MPELLLEVGIEELPASMVQSAAEQLLANVCAAVLENRLGDASDSRWYATPRRLIVVVPSVGERQPDQTIEKRGPAASSAYAADGAPTPALLGFAKSMGVDASTAVVRDDYVWITANIKGKNASDVLAEALPNAIRKISFDKTMRWGKGKTRFSRPIRWIVALHGGSVISFSVETASSGDFSFGHRFLAPEQFSVKSSDDLLAGLRARKVEPEPAVRERMIREGASAAKTGKALLTDALVAENVHLTEWPMPIAGTFRNEFSELPRPVLITAMAKHERFFPVEDSNGAITNEFISVTNAGESQTVRGGNEWVLNARFNDAKFFFDEDKRKTLDEFLSATERIVFQDKLGTIRQRADRMAVLAGAIADELGLDKAASEKAALYCKADLSTGLVSELPSLQGQVGGEYARRGGFAPEVCEGISNHYAPIIGNNIATAVMCADQADRLAGYLGIGEAPTGSSDPYALRKAATMLIQAQVDCQGWKSSILQLVGMAAKEYNTQGISVGSAEAHLADLLRGRYEALFDDIPHDALDAAWSAEWREPCSEFVKRARLLAELSNDVAFVRTAKRPANIVEAARKKGTYSEGGIDSSKFEAAEEGALHAALESAATKMGAAYDTSALRELKGPIDKFFDAVMVMADNEDVRNNRLRLLARADGLFRRIGDFSKIVIEGE